MATSRIIIEFENLSYYILKYWIMRVEEEGAN
jgi:hypothetical protein